MIEEKVETILYELQPMVLEENPSWLNLNKLKILANKSFLTNLISAIVFGASYLIPEFVGRHQDCPVRKLRNTGTRKMRKK